MGDDGGPHYVGALFEEVLSVVRVSKSFYRHCLGEEREVRHGALKVLAAAVGSKDGDWFVERLEKGGNETHMWVSYRSAVLLREQRVGCDGAPRYRVIGHAHALALAAHQQRALLLDQPDIERRFPHPALSRKGDERENLVTELLNEAGM